MAREALLVGVSRYESDGFPDLFCCVNDARAMETMVGTHWNDERNFFCTRLTTDEGNVGEAELRSAVRKLMQDAQSDDDLLFYFSGHGTICDGDGYLVTQDAEPDNPGYPMAELLRRVNRCRARSVLIVLDSCHSGEMGNTGDAGDLHQATLSQGVTILSASSPTQESREGQEYSLFTELVLAALAGGAADVRGHVSAASIYGYVEQVLSPLQQRPMYKSHARQLEPVRKCEPAVPDGVLRNLPDLFARGPDRPVQMDPTWEITETNHLPENVEKFNTFKMLRNGRLLTTEDNLDLYYVALGSKHVLLTPLGKLYWRLAKERIF